MKKIYINPLILACLLSIQSINAQNCLDVLKNNPLYSPSKDIINGRAWIRDAGYEGNPMLEENYWPKSDILYNGISFNDINLNYNLFKNELVVFLSEKGKEKYIVINKDHLLGFSFNDSILHRKRYFEYCELKGIAGRELYEKIPVSQVCFYVKPMIKFDAAPSQRTLGKFTGYSLYYLDTGSGYNSFRTKRQLLKMLTNHRPEVNRYIRKQQLKINQKHSEDVVAVIKYFDGLN